MKTFRAYRIDPAARSIKPFAFRGLPDLYSQVGTQNLDHATLRLADDSLLCLWVDGEGYYKPDLAWWRFEGYPNPLAGTTVMTAADVEGEDADVPLTLQEMTALVAWIEGRPRLPGATVSGPNGVIAEVDFNAADAPGSMEELYRRLFGVDPPAHG